MPAIHCRWSTARSLDEIGRIMADWIEGRVPGTHPGTYATSPDRETRPLRGPLAALNRGGYVTTDSQPGVTSRKVRQKAAVQGFAGRPTALRIVEAARRHGLLVVEGTWHIVTEVKGRPHTAFGERLPAADLDLQWRGVLQPKVYRELAAARQIAVVAPEWGPAGDRMWPLLAGAIR